MIRADLFETMLQRLIDLAGVSERIDITEKQTISVIEDILCDRDEALVAWDEFSLQLRRWTVRSAKAIQWNFIGSVVRIRTLPKAEELEGAAELYEHATPLDLEQRVRSLSGIEFEHFLGAILGRLPQFRNIAVTRPSRDEGIDVRG